MKAEDLMIGDWVQSRGKIEQVTSVYDGFICTDSFEDSHDYYFYPLPLTPEILEKNGFTTEDGVHYQIHGRALELLWQEIPFGKYQVDMVRTETGHNKKGEQYYIDHYIATTNFVHELQHALRLCGIEKEIVL